MRILQVVNWYIPDHGYQEYFLAEAWQRMGHDVLTVAGTRVYPREGFAKIEGLARPRKVPPGLYRERSTDVRRLPCFEVRHRIFLSTGLESLVREYEPDTIVTHGVTSPNALRVARLKHKTRKPFRLICDDHLLSTNTQNGVVGSAFYSVFRRTVAPALARSVDAFVPISEDTRDILNERCGIPMDMMTVIPLGVDVRGFRRDEERRQTVRKELRVGTEEVLLVFAGKLVIRKGVTKLIDAALQVLRSYAHAKLLVIGSGDGAYVEQHKRRVQEAGVQSRVAWLPLLPNNELAHYFSAADVGVWPQGHSIVILEAAACQLPIVCMNSRYHQDRFGNGAALLFNGFDEMLQSVQRLVADPELRRHTGRRAREAVKEYSWDRVAALFLEI